MPPQVSRKASQPKRLKLLDIGFGNAQRIAKYAKRVRSAKRFFYGIEKEKQLTLVPARQHNVKLMIGDAQKKVDKLPSKSLDIINMDFFPLTKINSKVVGGNMHGLIFNHEVVEVYPKLLASINRVLKKNGRLCLTVPAAAVGDVDAILYKNGFKEIYFYDVPASQKNFTSAMNGHFDLAKNDSSAIPCRVIAVKRES